MTLRPRSVPSPHVILTAGGHFPSNPHVPALREFNGYFLHLCQPFNFISIAQKNEIYKSPHDMQHSHVVNTTSIKTRVTVQEPKIAERQSRQDRETHTEKTQREYPRSSSGPQTPNTPKLSNIHLSRWHGTSFHAPLLAPPLHNMFT